MPTIIERERKRVEKARWRAANPEKSRAASAAWRKANPDKVRKQRAARYAANPEKVRAAVAAQRKANPDKLQMQRTARYRARREKILAQNAAWRAANLDKVKAGNAAWRKANSERVRALNQKRRARELGADGRVSDQDFANIVRLQKGKCAICRQTKKLTMDHIIPLARGGEHLPRNIQGLCRSCNSSKHAKDPIVHAQSLGLLL